MKNLILIVLLAFSFLNQSFAAEDSIRDFAHSLEKLFGIEARKTIEVGSRTHFAAQILPSSTAEASYNPLLNTIFLKRENLTSRNYVKSISALRADEPVVYSVKVGTIFHELGHAEMDQFVLNDITIDDRALHFVFVNEIKPWVKTNYAGVNPKTLFQEVYGYYRGDIIEVFFNDKASIEIFNGWNSYQRRCFATPYLKTAMMNYTREQFGEILFPENEKTWEEKYSDRFMPRYVFIQGNEVDLMKNPGAPFKEQWKKAIWSYVKQNYHLPANMRELAVFFKANHEDRFALKECRNKMWDDAHKTFKKRFL